MKNLKDCINNDLANNYGNLCQRVLVLLKTAKINKINKLNQNDEILLTNLKKIWKN